MQLSTKMGQHQIWFLAHFLGKEANAYCVKWFLPLTLDQGGRVWADSDMVETKKLGKKINAWMKKKNWGGAGELRIKSFALALAPLVKTRSCGSGKESFLLGIIRAWKENEEKHNCGHLFFRFSLWQKRRGKGVDYLIPNSRAKHVSENYLRNDVRNWAKCPDCIFSRRK